MTGGQSLFRIRKYFLQIRIRGSVTLNFGSGSCLDIFVAIEIKYFSNRYGSTGTVGLSLKLVMVIYLTFSEISLNLW